MAYLEYGPTQGETLILLHGIPTSSFLSRDVAPRIAQQTGYRVIAVDMLGFGASDKPKEEGLYTVSQQAKRMYAFADAVGVDHFVLALHDIGGVIGANMLTLSESKRIDALLITDTAVKLEGVTPAPLTMQIFTGEKTPREVWQPLDSLEFAEFATRQFLEIGFANDALITDELLEAYTIPISQGASEAFVQFFETVGTVLTDTALDTTFEQFDRPTAIIWGSEDAFFDADIVPVLFQQSFAVPDSLVTIIDGAGHYIQEEAPDAYVKAVSDFLNKAL